MKKILTLFVLVPLAAATAADHRPEFQSLIDEPANMLDIAMVRLQDFIFWTKPYMAGEYHIAAGTDKQRHIDINADYRADDGVIHISALLFDSQSSTEQMEAGCRRVLGMMRINVSKGLGRYFSHVDGSFRPSANGQPADLFGMIELSCQVDGGNTNGRQFRGVMPLKLGAEMEIIPIE
ncbi:MAG: hypothetical protein OEM63_11865 [Gammaproteobacteria bacterium]|nr:hypothetical protein [Gammaproteobacteria bacterium]